MSGIAWIMCSMPLLGESRPKVKQHVLAFDVELVLVEIGVDERHVGNAVVNDVDFLRGDLVDLLQELAAALRHDDHPRRQGRQLPHDAALVGAGLAQHGVQRGDDRHAEVAEQGENVRPAGPP